MNKLVRFFYFLPFVKRWHQERKYHRIGLSTIVLNSIVQRIFRYNGDCPWMVHFTSRVINPGKITIEQGDHAYLTYNSFAVSPGCYLQAINGIELKEGVLWAPGIRILTSNHDFKDYTRATENKPVVLGRNTWLATNVTILPEVELGDYVIVGAGSVVTRSFPAYSIIAGVPAKIISYRCTSCLDKLSKRDGAFSCENCGITFNETDFQ